MLLYYCTVMSHASVEGLVNAYRTSSAGKLRAIALGQLELHIKTRTHKGLLQSWVGGAAGDDTLIDLFEQRIALLERCVVIN